MNANSVIEQRRIKSLSRLIGLLALVTIAILSLVPGNLRPHTGAPGMLEHIAAYLLTAGFLSFGFGNIRNSVLIALCLSIYSGTLEVAQIYIPGRHAGLFDFVASSTGAFIGAALALIALRALSSDGA